MVVMTRLATFTAAVAMLAATGSNALAQKKYDTGASDTEIKIGNIMPYSGPASAYGVIGKSEQAYFNKINAEGGINGRKINFITYDDGYSPPKAVEQARKLVESDEVLIVYGPLGTPSNTAIQKYLNAKKIPQIFVANKFSGMPNLMHDALLYFGVGEDSTNSVFKAFQTIYADDQQIVNSTTMKVIQDRKPEFRTLVFSQIHAQYILMPCGRYT